MKVIRFFFAALSLAVCFAAGCGKQETIMPEGELTEEQKAAVKAEDEAIADEESGGGGTYVPPKGKKK